MRIQHNIAALNSHRQLTGNTNAVSKNLEKLSSGYRINRAGDDAAGLAISEKMRAQIKGLETAQKNANDGISLVQTGEGALTEVHSMLNRMVELATQSANGTYDNDVDRKNLQKEVNALKEEIDRISESTNYNGIKLLDGSLSADGGTKTAASTAIAKNFVNGNADATSVAAQAGEYNVRLELDTGDGSARWNVGNAGLLDVTLTDTTGKEHTLSFSFDNSTALSGADIAGKLAAVMTGDLDALDEDFVNLNKNSLDGLKEVFSSIKMEAVDDASATPVNDVLSITATGKNTGSDAVGLQSVTIKQRAVDDTGVPGTTANFDLNTSLSITATGALITQAPSDAATKITFSDLSAGNVYTFGDYSFELKSATDYNVSEGNVRVTIGKDDAETLNNIVAAMKSKGIQSAYVSSATAADKSIMVTNESELNRTVNFNKTVDVQSTSKSIDINAEEAKNATYSNTAEGGTASEATLTIDYKDADGNAKTAEIKYTPAAATAEGTANAIKAAVNSDENLKELFKVTTDAGSFKFESLGGAKGVTITNITTTDTDASLGATPTTSAYTGAGKTIEITGNNTITGDVISVGGKEYQFIKKDDAGDASKIKNGATAVIIGDDKTATAKNLQAALANNGVNSTINGAKLTIEDGSSNPTNDGGLTLQVGESSEDYQKVKVSIGNMDTKSLGIADINISTQKGASAAMDKIKAAINSVSSTRGDLGAIQNRLEHTINNLGVAEENMTAAESRIRDVDMAKEMMSYTKNNILVQASQAMLAQANQQPQGVLQLLQ